jgi:hypothetical protein
MKITHTKEPNDFVQALPKDRRVGDPMSRPKPSTSLEKYHVATPPAAETWKTAERNDVTQKKTKT